MVPYLNGKKRNPSQNQTHLFKQLSNVPTKPHKTTL